MNQKFKQAKQGNSIALEKIIHSILHEQFDNKSFVNGVDIRKSFTIQVTQHISKNIDKYVTLDNLKRAATAKLQVLLKEKAQTYNTPEKLIRIIANNAFPGTPNPNNEISKDCKEKACVLNKKLSTKCQECVKTGFNYSSVSILIKANLEKKFKLVGIDYVKQDWQKRTDASKANNLHKNGIKSLFYLLLTDHLTEGKSNRLISKVQHITSLQYFYRLQQKDIDAVTPKGVMGYRWRGKSKDVLSRFFIKALDRLNNDIILDATVKTKVDDYIDNIW